MALFLFCLFVIVPILEISVLIQVGSYLGTFTTIALMILSAAFGASLVKNQGLFTLMNIRQGLQEGRIPDQEIAEGILLAVAGVLLITPGFLTDGLGMSFLIPASRAYIAGILLKYVKMKVVSPASHTRARSAYGADKTPHQGTTIDGEYTRKDDL